MLLFVYFAFSLHTIRNLRVQTTSVPIYTLRCFATCSSWLFLGVFPDICPSKSHLHHCWKNFENLAYVLTISRDLFWKSCHTLFASSKERMKPVFKACDCPGGWSLEGKEKIQKPSRSSWKWANLPIDPSGRQVGRTELLLSLTWKQVPLRLAAEDSLPIPQTWHLLTGPRPLAWSPLGSVDLHVGLRLTRTRRSLSAAQIELGPGYNADFKKINN